MPVAASPKVAMKAFRQQLHLPVARFREIAMSNQRAAKGLAAPDNRADPELSGTRARRTGLLLINTVLQPTRSFGGG